MKFRAHETFFIRKGWLHKGLKNVIEEERIFIDRSINQTMVLGIGTNMVKSLRYWMQAVGLTEEVKQGNTTIQQLTNFGKIVWEYDSYIEEDGTLWLLHYSLASNKELATTWYWFFNIFNVREFIKKDFLDSLDGYVKYNLESGQVAITSLEDDFSCLANTYIPRRKTHPDKVSPENTIDCPLGALNIIDIIDAKKKIYKKITLKKDSIHPLIVLAVILDRYEKDETIKNSEIKITTLLNSPCNIGKIFVMDLNVLNYYLDRLQELGYLRVVRTAGLDVVKIDTKLISDDIVKKYYEELNTVGLR